MNEPAVATQLVGEIAALTDADRSALCRRLGRALGIKQMVKRSVAWHLHSPEFAERLAGVLAQAMREALE